MYAVMFFLICLLVIPVNAESKNAEKKEKPEETVVSIKQDKEPKENMLKTEMDKVSYAIGTQIGQNFKKQGIEISFGPLMQGLKDAVKGNKLILTQDEMQQAMMNFQKQMQAKQQELQKVEGPKNIAEGKAFLEINKKNEGVKELQSGLQYKIIKEGTGETPTVDSKVKTHYRGTLINGTEFDSSYKRNAPAEFPVNGVIKGWTEALQLMKVGAKWELYIPANLAYGERGTPGIPANSTLIFEIELLEIVKTTNSTQGGHDTSVGDHSGHNH